MADEKALKPKSFRITDETAEKFKEISATIGGNQQEALAKLIEAYEFQQGKAVLTEKKADLEKFEQYVAVLVRMYMGSLEDNQNITDTVRSEFEALLQSKDTVIQDLQAQLTTAKQLREQSTARAKEFADQNAQLSDTVQKLQTEYEAKTADLQKMMEDKDSLNKVLTDSCEELKEKIAVMQEDVKSLASVKEDLAKVTSERDETDHKRIVAENALVSVKQEHEKEIAHLKDQAKVERDRAILEAEKTHQEEMQGLKEKKQMEVDKYQQKYLDLLEKFENTQEEMRKLKAQSQAEIDKYQQKYMELLEKQ